MKNVSTEMNTAPHPAIIKRKNFSRLSIIVIHVLFLLLSPDAIRQATGLIRELTPSPTRRLRLREIVRVRTAGHRLCLLPAVVVAAVVLVLMFQDLWGLALSADHLA